MKENIFLLKRNPSEGISYISLQGINVILEGLTVCIVHVSGQYHLNSALIFFSFFSTPDNHRANKLGV